MRIGWTGFRHGARLRALPRRAAHQSVALACLLAALGGPVASAKAQESGAAAEQPPHVITADMLSYDSERDVVTASGDVEISSGERRLLADQVRYDQAADKVYATGNVVLIEPTGEALFGDEVEVTGDLREGFVNSVGILLDDDSRIAATRGVRREGNVIELDRAVYSPCPLCREGDGGPLWQIKARRAIYDERAQTITYRDARMELFGVPVAYTPWFRHTAPGVERQSGFLAPTLGTTSELGFLAQFPYYYVLSPSADLTVAPLFTQKGGTVLGGEYRRLHRNGYTYLAASGTYAELDESDLESERGKTFRGHVKADGGYSITETTQAGYNVFLTTDDTYLDRYQIADDDVLKNRLYVEGVPDRDYWAVNGYYFQGLRPFDDQDTIPVALPLAEARLVSDRYRWGSYFTVDSNVLALTRHDGLDTRRVSNRLGWTLPYVGPIGEVYSLDLSVRGDVYNTEGDPQTFSSEGGENTTGRVLPRLTLDWSWPLADATGTWAHEVEPTVSFNVAPTDGNSDEIPNEDSTDFEFDETNLFEPIRFPGLDVNEGGTKIAYGLRFSSFGPRAAEVSGVFGQSYAFTGGSEFPAETGLREGFSDYVGALYLRPSPLLDLSYRFRLGRDDLRFRRTDALAAFGPAFLRFNLGYLNLSREPEAFDDDSRGFANARGFASREEIVLGTRAQLTERIAVGAQTRRDLSANQTVANQFGLIYTHPCLVLAVGLEQRMTPDAELGDETVFLFRISFENLGEFETGGGLFGSE
ncbi:MAG TPA: LPS assembly protein LptD [Geminicoccaceae bacterium]|nr:LPS assembly protein LptD [Geminicoccaceae bacterium]